MAKWETYFFKMNRGLPDERTVAGVAYRGLALLKNSKKDTWSLTHMRSGLRVIQIQGKLKDVRRIGAAIAELIDWQEFEGGADISNAHPALTKQIEAIAMWAESGCATAGAA